MLRGIAQVLAAHRLQVGLGVIKAIASVKMHGKALKAASQDLSQQMIPVWIVAIGRLVRHAESAGDIAQTQVLDAMLRNEVAGHLDAGFLQIDRLYGLDLFGHPSLGSQWLKR